MKKIVIIIIGVFYALGVSAQELSGGITIDDYSNYVEIIKSNNPSLKALKLTFESQESSNKIGIVPNDPVVTIKPNFKGELEVEADIEFAFPTVYHHMKKMAKMSTKKNEYEYFVALFQEMQDIDKAFIEAVYVNKKIKLLEQVYKGNKNIRKHFALSVEKGNTSLLDLNTATAELLVSSSAISEAKLEYSNLMNRILSLNGGASIFISSIQYPIYNIGDIDTYVERAMERSFDIQITNADSLIVAQNLKLNKNMWAPNISVAYGHGLALGAPSDNTGSLSIGVSIPLWQNSHKVRASRLQYSAMMETNRRTRLDVESSLGILKNNYIMAFDNYKLHEEFFASSSSMNLLGIALAERQISIIDYYSEVNLIVNIELQKLAYEYRLVTTLSEMKSLLY